MDIIKMHIAASLMRLPAHYRPSPLPIAAVYDFLAGYEEEEHAGLLHLFDAICQSDPESAMGNGWRVKMDGVIAQLVGVSETVEVSLNEKTFEDLQRDVMAKKGLVEGGPMGAPPAEDVVDPIVAAEASEGDSDGGDGSAEPDWPAEPVTSAKASGAGPVTPLGRRRAGGKKVKYQKGGKDVT